MGKNLIQQARGKGGPRYRAPSFRYKGESRYIKNEGITLTGKIIDLVRCQGHSAPLAQIEYENGGVVLVQAPEGIRVGDKVKIGDNIDVRTGNIMPLKSIPEGIAIYNIEAFPGDGGKFVRASGGFAKIITKSGLTKYVENYSKSITFHGRLADLLTQVDITAKMIAEQKVRESEEKYRHLYESSPYAILLVNMEGKIIDCNKAAELLSGFQRSELLGKSFANSSFIPKEHIYSVLKDYKSLIKTI